LGHLSPQLIFFFFKKTTTTGLGSGLNSREPVYKCEALSSNTSPQKQKNKNQGTLHKFSFFLTE
jgi:hypothetical protein